MLACVLFGLLASAYAAPQYYHRHHHGPPPPFPHDDYFRRDPFFGDGVFDTGRFWAELSREMAAFDQMLNEFTKHFPTSVSSEGVDTKTNEYKITIPITGFDEKELAVKAREGVLMVQAIKKQDNNVVKSYLDVRSLPDYVNVNGSWTYNEGVLKIVFPLLPRGDGKTTSEASVDITTQLPEQFKPESTEVENNSDGNSDADVGLSRGDSEINHELRTNEIPDREQIEATTYAVDLKDEVEFVPVNY